MFLMLYNFVLRIVLLYIVMVLYVILIDNCFDIKWFYVLFVEFLIIKYNGGLVIKVVICIISSVWGVVFLYG